MGQKKHCICCDENKTVTKIVDRKLKPNNQKTISIKLTRIEDDLNLLDWISKNLKTDIDIKLWKRQALVNRKKQNSSKDEVQHNQQCKKLPVKKKNNKLLSDKKLNFTKLQKKQNFNNNSTIIKSLHVKMKRINNGHKVDKKKNCANNNELNVKKENTKSEIDKGQVVKKKCPKDNSIITQNEFISTTPSLSFDFIDTTCSSPQLHQKEKSKNGQYISDFIDLQDNDCITESENIVAVTVAGPCSPNNVCANQTGMSDIQNMSCSSENNAAIDLEESLGLISKLTGYNVHPSKVEVLSLPSCDADLPEMKSIENISEKQKKLNEKETKTDHTFSSSHEVINQNKRCNNSASSINNDVVNDSTVNSVSTEVRTIYDLMNDVSTISPSWNLHILPDTNTFCIGQVTRNKLGIPHLTKCIELDGDFNAKVYIYQQHCKKFDGIYDSEDTVAGLINRVDHFY